MRIGSVPLAALALAACTHAPAPRPEAPPPEPAPVAEPAAPAFDIGAEARLVVAKLVAFRGLAEKEPLRIEVRDEDAFRLKLKEILDEGIKPGDVRKERARWLAFGFAPPDADPEAIARGVLGEQVAGFYHHQSRTLHVPRKQDESPEEARGVLAHEIEHGLQDQHFGIGGLESLPDDDQRLAQQAAWEGEAMLVMLAFMADGKLERQRVVGLTRMLEKLPLEAMMELSGNSRQLLEAPRIVRDELILPYISGLSLVGQVYAAGGWPMVDRFLRKPPASTEQVLHPGKYFTGEQPIPVATPAVPEGHRLVVSGRLGELGIRSLLDGCDVEDAADAARGWGGDAWTISEAADGALALQWVTTWDSEADARAFEAALGPLDGCWTATQLPDGAKDPWRISDDVLTTKPGPRTVALVRGLPTEQAARLLRGAAPDAVGPVLDAPLGPGTFAAPEEATAVATAPDGTWTSARLGVSMRVPTGFVVAGTPQAELMVRSGSGAPAVGTLAFVPTPYTEATRGLMFDALTQELGTALGGARLVLEREGPGPGGAGWERAWSVEGAPMRVRAVLLPACGGGAGLLLTSMWSDAPARTALEGWVHSLRTDPGGAAACAR